MNKDNAHEYLPLVQALADGKMIQYFDDNGGWSDRPEPLMTGNPEWYRVKPEPRTFDVWLAPHGAMYPISNTQLPTWERITVQEVL